MPVLGVRGLSLPHTKVTEKLRMPKAGATAPPERQKGRRNLRLLCLLPGTPARGRKPRRKEGNHFLLESLGWKKFYQLPPGDGPSGGLRVSAAVEVPSSVQ